MGSKISLGGREAGSRAWLPVRERFTADPVLGLCDDIRFQSKDALCRGWGIGTAARGGWSLGRQVRGS